MTAAELARIFSVSIRTIRRWAAEDHWQPQRYPARPLRYSALWAQRSYDKRHTRRIPQK